MAQLAMEIVAFGLPFYFISGLAYEPTAFFVYLAILIGKLELSVFVVIITSNLTPNARIYKSFLVVAAYKFGELKLSVFNVKLTSKLMI